MVENWNRCAQEASTEFFCILHQDDCHTSSYIDECVSALRAHPEAGLVYTDVEVIDEQGSIVQSKRFKIKERIPHGPSSANGLRIWPSMELGKELLRGDFINCPTVFFRKSAFETIGPFDSRFKQVQDWEYWFRACVKGVAFIHLQKKLYLYRDHKGSASSEYRKQLLKYEERAQLVREMFQMAQDRNWVAPKDWVTVRRTIFDVLLWDAAENLAEGQKDLFNSKFDFAEKRWPEFCRYFPAVFLKKWSALGRIGAKVALFGVQLLAKLRIV